MTTGYDFSHGLGNRQEVSLLLFIDPTSSSCGWFRGRAGTAGGAFRCDGFIHSFIDGFIDGERGSTDSSVGVERLTDTSSSFPSRARARRGGGSRGGGRGGGHATAARVALRVYRE